MREAWVQAHGISVQRVKDCIAQGDIGSFGSLGEELRSVSDARRTGTPNDVRSALLAVAATCVLLAERVDRPEELARGTKRASTDRWRPIAFGVPRAA